VTGDSVFLQLVGPAAEPAAPSMHMPCDPSLGGRHPDAPPTTASDGLRADDHPQAWRFLPSKNGHAPQVTEVQLAQELKVRIEIVSPPPVPLLDGRLVHIPRLATLGTAEQRPATGSAQSTRAFDARDYLYLVSSALMAAPRQTHIAVTGTRASGGWLAILHTGWPLSGTR